MHPIIKNYQTPFVEKVARKVLLKSIQRLSMKGYHEIADKLPLFDKPVQIIYGEKDKILPEVKDTMTKVKKDLPQANVVSFPNCGHFLQEEAALEISQILSAFVNSK
ncbi:MAG: alpha/beta hydrolase [Saprospiraceae bacterium]|jgi:pimeloyl-ACP methyl ester carboxylesterase|nr:alpha/beta hydrolase [Saprospiraceae bacterium]